MFVLAISTDAKSIFFALFRALAIPGELSTAIVVICLNWQQASMLFFVGSDF